MSITLKRAYDPPAKGDGTRILVDRLWPRGINKERAKIHLWLKEAAPSSELRTWFAHDPGKWRTFKARYFKELDNNPDVVDVLADKARHCDVTLVYAARDTCHNNAVALKSYLESRRNISR